MIEQTITIKVDELYTPCELIDIFPNCEMSARQIGFAYFTGTVAGIKPSSSQTCLIYLESFAELLQIRKNVPKLKIICE